MARQTFSWKIDYIISVLKRLLAGQASWPVGSIYISVNSTNPATSLGFGTWSAFGTGRVPVGIDAGDTDFDVDEEEGGAKAATIATANLPNISTGSGTAHKHGGTVESSSHSHDAKTNATGTTGTGQRFAQNAGGISQNDIVVSSSHSHNLGALMNNESSHTHSLGGSGTALTIQQKYIVVRMWKRTA